MIDSATIVSETQTPSQAPQPNNVLKCPVLSGPTDPTEQKDVSTASNTTCERTPSSPDQTSAAPAPPAVPQQDQTSDSDVSHTVETCHPTVPACIAHLSLAVPRFTMPSLVGVATQAVVEKQRESETTGGEKSPTRPQHNQTNEEELATDFTDDTDKTKH